MGPHKYPTEWSPAEVDFVAQLSSGFPWEYLIVSSASAGATICSSAVGKMAKDESMADQFIL